MTKQTNHSFWGGTRVTPQEIVEMHRLYAELGNYAAVGRVMGRSGSTVARYIKMKGTPNIIRHTFVNVVNDKGKRENV